jgi:hypothetical protein
MWAGQHSSPEVALGARTLTVFVHRSAVPFLFMVLRKRFVRTSARRCAVTRFPTERARMLPSGARTAFRTPRPMPVTANEVLGAMITPAILISASGTLMLSTSNRLSRVVDRVRALTRDAETLGSEVVHAHLKKKRALIASQLAGLAERALILRSALAALYTAIGFLVATSVDVGILTSIGLSLTWPTIVLALCGACALLWGSVLLVREGRLAIGSTLEEMTYVRGVMAESARTDGPGETPQ